MKSGKLLSCVVTVDIVYYMPDYHYLLNEFVWQTDDIVPDIPRVHKFLLFWKNNIPAIIKEVQISHSYQREWKKIDWEYKC